MERCFQNAQCVQCVHSFSVRLVYFETKTAFYTLHTPQTLCTLLALFTLLTLYTMSTLHTMHTLYCVYKVYIACSVSHVHKYKYIYIYRLICMYAHTLIVVYEDHSHVLADVHVTV